MLIIKVRVIQVNFITFHFLALNRRTASFAYTFINIYFNSSTIPTEWLAANILTLAVNKSVYSVYIFLLHKYTHWPFFLVCVPSLLINVTITSVTHARFVFPSLPFIYFLFHFPRL